MAEPRRCYSHSSPLVFSLVVRCHGLCGSQKYNRHPGHRVWSVQATAWSRDHAAKLLRAGSGGLRFGYRGRALAYGPLALATCGAIWPTSRFLEVWAIGTALTR